MDWNSKATKKHIKEAEAVGLTLVGEGKNHIYRTYSFDNCGHEQEIAITSVRNNEFKCNLCHQNKLEEEANAVGLTLLGEGRTANYRTYRFNKCNHEQEIQPSEVRSNNFRCKQCIQIKHEEEAKAVGLTLIGEGRNYSYRTYRFNDCKHKQEIRISEVRSNNFRCKQCIQIKHEKEANAVGLTLIGKGKNRSYRTYRFNVCKHEQEIDISSVRNNEFKCNLCHQNKLEEEAKAVGLTLVGEGRNAQYRTYRFNDCGHEQEIQTSGVRNNEFKCNLCHQNKLEEEAKAVGLTLIGKGRNTNHRTYRFKKCNHEQEISVSAIRNNEFICNTCEETSRDLPSKVYLLEIQSGSFIWLKLGYAKTVKNRIKGYGLPEDAKVKRLRIIDFDTGREAHNFESSLHTKYKRKRLPVKKMKDFHKDGFNECYPLEMLDKLMEELESG